MESTPKLGAYVNSIVSKVLLVISAIICSYLFLQGLFTDVRIGNTEKCYFTTSGFVIPLVAFVAVNIGYYIYHRYIKLNDTIVKKFVYFFGLIFLFFVIISHFEPRGDQNHILSIATEIWQGNYVSEPGDYMNRYPNQNGIVLFCFLLCKLGGGFNFLLFQLLNALALGWMYRSIYCYYKSFKKERTDEIVIALALFIPLILYVTFVYGTLIGLSFAVNAILQQQLFFVNRSKKNLLLSVVFILIACTLKSNYSIFLIGLLILFLLDQKSDIKNRLFSVIVILVMFVIANHLVNVAFSYVTESKPDDQHAGIPKMAWMVMGLQESFRAPGWFNGYNVAIYEENDYDTKKTNAACIEDLKKEIVYKIEHPVDSLHFFQKKITSIWCDSSFSGFFNNRIDYQSELAGHSRMYNDIIVDTGRTHRILLVFMEAYSSMIYFGVFLYCIYMRKKTELPELIGLLIFIGGFVFHLIWEGKSSYALIFFVLLIPYGIRGLGVMYDQLANVSLVDIRWRSIGKIILAIFSLMIGGLLSISDNNEEWASYLKEHRFIDDACYDLMPIESDNTVFDEQLLLKLFTDNTWQYEFCSVDGEKRLAVDEESL